MDLLALPSGLTLAVARSRRERALGLLPARRLAPDRGLLLPRCRSVHTVGMRFALDLLWLDEAAALVRLDASVGPFRQRSARRARGVLEVAAGAGRAWSDALHDPCCAAGVAAILADVDCHDCPGASSLTRLHLS